MRVRLKGINTVSYKRADGSVAVYRYHRATGEPLEGEPGTQEFMQSYAKAERLTVDRGRGVFSSLIKKFEGSAEYAALSDSTKVEYTRKFKVIDKKWGTVPIAGLIERDFRIDVLEWRDGIARKAPREADNLASAIARVLSWSAERGHISANVLDKFTRAYHSDRSDMIWLPNHVTAFINNASQALYQVMMLALHTGQRQGDLRRLAWSAYDGAGLTIRQRVKGKVQKWRTVYVPCTAALKAMLDGMARRGPLILLTDSGRAWTKRYLNECWQEVCKAAGIVDLHFHDLRGTAITMLAEVGCTALEIASITGHSFETVTKILEKYLSRTRALAQSAMVKYETHPRLAT